MVVHGEMESVKIGYQIRQLSLEKRDLVHAQKQLEYEIASLKTPERLEAWVATNHVKLGSAKVTRLARLEPRPAGGEKTGVLTQIAKLFLGTAQAGSDK